MKNDVLIVVKKTKVLVKIYTLDDEGSEGEIIRQFTVNGRTKTEYQMALKICERIEKKYEVDDIELWNYE